MNNHDNAYSNATNNDNNTTNNNNNNDNDNDDTDIDNNNSSDNNHNMHKRDCPRRRQATRPWATPATPWRRSAPRDSAGPGLMIVIILLIQLMIIY